MIDIFKYISGVLWFSLDYVLAFLATSVTLVVIFKTPLQKVFQMTYDEIRDYLVLWRGRVFQEGNERSVTDAVVFLGCCLFAGVVFLSTVELFIFILSEFRALRWHQS